MSTHLKDKQKDQKGKESHANRELQADFHFNQHVFRTIAYTAAGFGIGMLSSLLFKHKAGMTIFFAGTGAGYGGANFINELTTFRNQRNWTQINQREGQGQGQSRFPGQDKLERLGDKASGALHQAKDKAEHGIEDASRYMANKVSQSARGAEDLGKSVSDKVSQGVEKLQRRGGDDDHDDKSSSKRSDSSKEHTQRRESDQHRKDNSKDQKKEGENQKSSSSSQAAKQGSAQHTNIDNMRLDQYTTKSNDDKNANQGYQNPKQQFEGAAVKREDKSKFGQGQSAADQNKTQNIGGQHFQDFKSNPVEPGPKTQTHHGKVDYQLNRNQANQEELDNRRRQVHGLEQDRIGQSTKQGNNIRVNLESETKQGFQNYKTGVAPSLNHNQVNAEL